MSDDTDSNHFLSASEDSLLISLVKGCPNLYDRKSKDFRDAQMKENSWKEIGTIMNVNPEDCQARWIRLRERYTRELKQVDIETRSGVRQTLRYSWPHASELSFLQPHIWKRRTYKNLSEGMDNNHSQSPSEDSLLITLVKGHPHLYDRRSKEFRDVQLKENSWKEVGAIMDMKPDDCQIRWLRLRERYSREVKLIEFERRSGIEQSSRKNWPHLEEMSFLKPNILRRRTYVNVLDNMDSCHSQSDNMDDCHLQSNTENCHSQSDNMDNCHSQSDNCHSQSDNMDNCHSQSPSQTVIYPHACIEIAADDVSTPPQKKSKIKHDIIEETFLKVANAVTKTCNRKEKDDDDDIFGKLVASELRKIDEGKTKSQLKIKILQLIYDYT